MAHFLPLFGKIAAKLVDFGGFLKPPKIVQKLFTSLDDFGAKLGFLKTRGSVFKFIFIWTGFARSKKPLFSGFKKVAF